MSSICIFGSTARMQDDEYSDRDVAIVASSTAELKEISDQWSHSGWSVTAFTREQMLSLAHRKSVFVQHLKQEGSLIHDGGNFLAELFAHFEPGLDFSEEIAESTRLLHAIRGRTTNTWTSLCCADIAYGTIRGIAIRRFAERGDYIFDFKNLTSRLGTEYNLSQSEVDDLAKLRMLKHNYRRRVRSDDSKWVVQRVLDVVSELFRETDIATANDQDRFSYYDLRLLELALLDRHDPRELDLLPHGTSISNAWRVIRNPRGYPDRDRYDETALRNVARRYGSPRSQEPH